MWQSHQLNQTSVTAGVIRAN